MSISILRFRRTLKEESRDVIAIAFATAKATCVQEHCARRYLAQQALERYTVLVKADVQQLPSHLHAIVGALTYAKAEVLWYFRNVNEVMSSADDQGNAAPKVGQYASHCILPQAGGESCQCTVVRNKCTC